MNQRQSSLKIEYTVMGDAANLASRLESLTSDFDYPILISEETFDAIGTFMPNHCPMCRQKGRLNLLRFMD